MFGKGKRFIPTKEKLVQLSQMSPEQIAEEMKINSDERPDINIFKPTFSAYYLMFLVALIAAANMVI